MSSQDAPRAVPMPTMAASPAPAVASTPGWDEERLARAALTAVCEAGSYDLAARVAEHGAAAVLRALVDSSRDGRWNLRARALDPERLVRGAERHRVRFVVPGDAEWPTQLDVLATVRAAGLGGVPLGLWVRGPGHLAQWTARGIGMVGSRASTAYGEMVANDLAIDLARPTETDEPWTIVSGGAYGIDGAAHRGALAAPGHTVAVLASGLDAPYPRGNQQLFDALVASQLLVSEVPCGMHPTRVGFLARNRVIAALCTGVVVVEAGARSGANNTATWAGECGRELMAVPGPVHSATSVGPHRLIRDGRAVLVGSAADVRAVVCPLDRAPQLPIGGPSRPLDQVEPELLAVREVLPGRGTLPTGEVAARAGLGMAAALASLAQLERLELVRQDETGEWRLSRPRTRADSPG